MEFVRRIARYLIEQSAVMSLLGELSGFLLSRDLLRSFLGESQVI